MDTAPAKMLLVDDDAFFLKILSDAFQEAGYIVFTAQDGVAGVRAYIEHDPDVVISDLIMPRLGGVSTCLEISRLAGERAPIIILLTSMFHGVPHEHQNPEMGATIHIPKSCKPLDIVIIVEQLIERKKQRPTAA